MMSQEQYRRNHHMSLAARAAGIDPVRDPHKKGYPVFLLHERFAAEIEAGMEADRRWIEHVESIRPQREEIAIEVAPDTLRLSASVMRRLDWGGMIVLPESTIVAREEKILTTHQPIRLDTWRWLQGAGIKARGAMRYGEVTGVVDCVDFINGRLATTRGAQLRIYPVLVFQGEPEQARANAAMYRLYCQ
ncbi:hypothetical protein [Belnapia moabensis]|uniref:hypothetical protein n=1 Tax=Belnapia moabensis TaxID=365533 RepID=UPI0005BD8988|nr:hypothetical protein [Belnapia moabensis]